MKPNGPGFHPMAQMANMGLPGGVMNMGFGPKEGMLMQNGGLQ